MPDEKPRNSTATTRGSRWTAAAASTRRIAGLIEQQPLDWNRYRKPIERRRGNGQGSKTAVCRQGGGFLVNAVLLYRRHCVEVFYSPCPTRSARLAQILVFFSFAHLARFLR
jgi:hypothetical protein